MCNQTNQPKVNVKLASVWHECKCCWFIKYIFWKGKNAKKYWFNKFQRRGKNTIHLLPPFDQICKVDERDIHLQRREKYFRSTLTFCYFISLKIGPLEIVHPVNTRNIYRRSFALRNNTLTNESISAELFTIIVQSFCNFERLDVPWSQRFMLVVILRKCGKVTNFNWIWKKFLTTC